MTHERTDEDVVRAALTVYPQGNVKRSLEARAALDNLTARLAQAEQERDEWKAGALDDANEIARLRAALERLASVKAFLVTKDATEDDEMMARIHFAREALTTPGESS